MAATINLLRNPDKGEYRTKGLNVSARSLATRTALTTGLSALSLVFVITAAFSLTLAQSQNNDQQNSSAVPQTSINPKLPTIFVVGDSTANNHANGALGWGDPFISYFDLSKVNVVNRARGGRSTTEQ